MSTQVEGVQLDVICAGLGRTGTSSLKAALETLGFGPCYHMRVLRERPSHAALWRQVMEGNADWPALLSGYRAVADEPAALYWRTLAEMCPNAKVILNTRAAEDWYASFSQTIHVAVQNRHLVEDVPSANLLSLDNDMIFEGLFGGEFLDQKKAIGVFEARNQAVIDTIDADRLLVYNVAEGWEPLCKFLAVPVPDEPFPYVNTRADFLQRNKLDTSQEGR